MFSGMSDIKILPCKESLSKINPIRWEANPIYGKWNKLKKKNIFTTVQKQNTWGHKIKLIKILMIYTYDK